MALRDKAAITVIHRFVADHRDYFEWLRDDGFSEFLTVCLRDLQRSSCKLVDLFASYYLYQRNPGLLADGRVCCTNYSYFKR